MERFTGKLALVLLNDKTHTVLRDGRVLWALQRPLTYRSDIGGVGDIVVPAGFVTDLASIPRLVTSVFPPDGPWAEAAVVHDALYYCRGGANLWHGRRVISREKPYSREECDAVLREAMTDLNVPALKRQIIWSAVRVGGAHAFGT